MTKRPVVSVIIPARNAAEHLAACLEALAETRYRYCEVIVVDDGSTDGTRRVAEEAGVRVLALPASGAQQGAGRFDDGRARPGHPNRDAPDRQGGAERISLSCSSCSSCPSVLDSSFRTPKGPAFARNRGAEVARGEILFFIDADVLVQPTTVGDVAAAFGADPGLAALFGSYDDAPAHAGFLSQYRNLFHHFVHQRASETATTFWSGCGAIRRGVFLAAGGFDARRYGRPAVEDIELGYRLAAAGCRIRLLKSLQVQHRKRWTLAAMVRCDLLDRAVPWTRLSLERGGLPRDLNVSPTQRAAALCALAGPAALALGCTACPPLQPALLAFASAALAGVGLLNAPWYRFLVARRGLFFAARAFPVLILYYHYSALGLLLGVALHLRDRLSTTSR